MTFRALWFDFRSRLGARSSLLRPAALAVSVLISASCEDSYGPLFRDTEPLAPSMGGAGGAGDDAGPATPERSPSNSADASTNGGGGVGGQDDGAGNGSVSSDAGAPLDDA